MTIIPSSSPMLVSKLSWGSTTVKSVKENEIQLIGSTTAKIATLIAILIAFLGGIHKSSQGALTSTMLMVNTLSHS